MGEISLNLKIRTWVMWCYGAMLGTCSMRSITMLGAGAGWTSCPACWACFVRKW